MKLSEKIEVIQCLVKRTWMIDDIQALTSMKVIIVSNLWILQTVSDIEENKLD